MLGLLLFNIFINDLYLSISKADLLHFADDNTVSAAENTIEKLISTLEQDSQAAINWFKINEMVANPDNCCEEKLQNERSLCPKHQQPNY